MREWTRRAECGIDHSEAELPSDSPSGIIPAFNFSPENTVMSKRRTRELRRQFLKQAAFGAAMFTTPGLFAEELEKAELTRTARQTEGPFYPDKMPLDTDNDLLLINDSTTPSVGTITHLTGRVVDVFGDPVRNATVEIWQADSNGVYIHTRSDQADKRDAHFQGYGRFLTSRKGEYYFRTIKPARYPGRTPHIHVAVSSHGKRMLTTQLYIKGDKQNDSDVLLKRVQDKKARESIITDFKAIEDSKIGELAAHFEIVIGQTPEDQPGDRPQQSPPRRNG